MSTVTTSDQSWQSIYALLKTCPGLYVGNELHCRRFVEAILWMARSRTPWRLLPGAYGNWNSIYKRFARWEQHGIWQQLFQQVAVDPDRELCFPDRTVICAHPWAAGALILTTP